MYQLTYRSISQPNLGTVHLDNILEEARTRNLDKNVTGCLVYHKERFVQVLEGTKKDVQKIYDKIKKDPRHHSMTLLWEGPAEKRYFSEWTMAFYRYDQNKKSAIIEKRFENNLLLLSQFSDRSSAAMLTFWGTIRKFLTDKISNGVPISNKMDQPKPKL